MATLLNLTTIPVTIGTQNFGPFPVAASNGLKARVGRSGLPSGNLAVVTPSFSFDGGNNYVTQFSLFLQGGTILGRDSLPATETIVSTEWQTDSQGTKLIPTHVKLAVQINSAFTVPTLIVETI